MVRKNQQTVFKKKRKKFFTGVRKQDLQRRSEATTVSELDTFAPCSPAKKNCSLDKINGYYSLEETEHSRVYARTMRLELGLK